MITANRFTINHMNPTNFKITGLIAKSRARLRLGLPNFVASCGAGFRQASKGGFERRRAGSQSVLKYALVIVCVVGALGCQRSKDRGGLQEVREGKVVGGSMAPNFLGEHFLFQCESCDSRVVADFAQSKKRSDLICPYCSTSGSLLSCQRKDSDGVKLEVGGQEIQRWDVVAFKVKPETAGIKRVVGLPGETIQIRGGNLWREGKLIQKSVPDQKRTRILIHDSNKTSSASLDWQAVDSAGSRLETSKHRFANRKFNFDSSPDGRKLQWFQFCNQRNYAHTSDSETPPTDGEIQAWPIEDHYGYNQSLARKLNVVDEIFVSLNFLPVATRGIAWRFANGANSYEFAIDVEQKELAISQLEVSSGLAIDHATQRFQLAESLFANAEIEVEFSTIDKMAVILIGGTEVTRFQLESAPEKKRAERSKDDARQLLRLGAEVVPGAEQSPIGRVRIWRDIYYLVAEENGGQSQTLVGSPDGFLLLGDNQPVSIDSRHWPDVSVSKTDLIGKVRK